MRACLAHVPSRTCGYGSLTVHGKVSAGNSLQEKLWKRCISKRQLHAAGLGLLGKCGVRVCTHIQNGGPTTVGANNWPLRGTKHTVWEGGTRGSAFIHGFMLNKTGYTYNG